MLHRPVSRPAASSAARPVARDNLHLTLCFLGDLDAQQSAALCAQLDAIEYPAFELQLQTPGYFKQPRIAWLGLKTSAPALAQFVMRLNTAVCRVLPDFRAPNNFIAHVSLLRNASTATPDELPELINWPVKDFVLVESVNRSDAVEYRVLQRWPLA